MDATIVSTSVFVGYLAFYTAYSKTEKRLKPSQLIEILTFRGGVDKFFVEMNKAISLSGLTTLCLAFCPFIDMLSFGVKVDGFQSGLPLSRELLISALIQIQIHSLYSLYKYYGTLNIPPIDSLPGIKQIATALKMRSKPKFKEGKLVKWRQTSNVSGLVGELAMYTWLFAYADFVTTGVVTVLLGLTHFYLMEIDIKWVLRVRPFAYLPFIVGPLALGNLVYLNYADCLGQLFAIAQEEIPVVVQQQTA